MQRTTIRPRLPGLPVALALSIGLAGCGSSGPNVHVRSGPAFAEAFPDPEVLVTTADVAGTRRKLGEAWLPATDEHHDMLRRLLAERQSIAAGHLLLLVEVVAHDRDVGTIFVDGDVYRFPQRGAGRYAHVADELLLAGLPKLGSLSRRELGALLGRTQGNDAMLTLARELLPRVDDGSPEAMLEILRGMTGSPAEDELLTRYLLPNGLLDGERGWAVLAQLSFDDERSRMVRALADRHASVAADRLIDVLGRMSSDDGRIACVDALLGKVPSLSLQHGNQIVAAFSFDGGRVHAVEALARSGRFGLAHDQLAGFLEPFAFDDARVDAVRVLVPCLQGDADARSARALLDAMSFDSGRMSVVELMAPTWRRLNESARESILAAFSFDGERERARSRLR